MAKYTRLTDSERFLEANQIWASGESNFQTFASGEAEGASIIARYPYDAGIVGQDILQNISGIPQSLKMDTFKGLDNRMLIYSTARRDGNEPNFLMPNGLEWKD